MNFSAKFHPSMHNDRLLPMAMKCCMYKKWVILLLVLATSLSLVQATKDVALQGMMTDGHVAPETMKKNTTSMHAVMIYSESDSESQASADTTTPTDNQRVGFTRLRHLLVWRRHRPGRMKPTTVLSNKLNEKLEEARRIFLDRMAAVSFTLINQENDATMSNGTLFEMDGDDDAITPQSDLCLPNRSIYVVTTAALPWRTGTSINPLLRAAYLARRAKVNTSNQRLSDSQFSEEKPSSNSTSQQQVVTLVIPWLELEEDRLELYGPDKKFADVEEQEEYIRDWLRRDAKMEDIANGETGLRIVFYPARYHSGLKSIFAMGDICAVLRNYTDGNRLKDAVCILEEPEHLNWYRAPGEGMDKSVQLCGRNRSYKLHRVRRNTISWSVDSKLSLLVMFSLRHLAFLITVYTPEILPGSSNPGHVVSYDKSLLP